MPIRFHERGGFFKIGDGLADPALAEDQPCSLAIDFPGFRIEPNRGLDFLSRLVLVPLLFEEMRLDAMRLGKVRIDRKRPLRRRLRIDIHAMPEAQLRLGERHQRPGLGVIGIKDSA